MPIPDPMIEKLNHNIKIELQCVAAKANQLCALNADCTDEALMLCVRELRRELSILYELCRDRAGTTQTILAPREIAWSDLFQKPKVEDYR